MGNSAFGQALEDGDLKLPDDSPLPACETDLLHSAAIRNLLGATFSGTTAPVLPFIIVGDAAFPLRRYMAIYVTSISREKS